MVHKDLKKDVRIKSSGILKGNLLYINTTPLKQGIVFFEPAQKQKIKISGQKEKVDVQVPVMVFIGQGSKVSVFFCPDEHPHQDSQLFHVPLANITNGSVCNGSAKLRILDSSSIESMIQAYSALFWQPAFTNDDGLKELAEFQQNKDWKIFEKHKFTLWGEVNKHFNDLDYEDEEDEIDY